MTNAEKCVQYRRNRNRELGRVKKEREELRFAMRARLAKRDLDYAESPYAAPVTVEYSGNRVIETRGLKCIGAYAVNHYTHI